MQQDPSAQPQPLQQVPQPPQQLAVDPSIVQPPQQQVNIQTQVSPIGQNQPQIVADSSSSTQDPQPTTHNPQSTPDPAVDQVVQQGIDLHNTLSQPAFESNSKPDDTLIDDQIFADSDNQLDNDDVADKNEEKNPLDMLEEILGKGAAKEDEKKGDESEEPKEPEKTPEELEAERKIREEQDKAEIEEHRKQMMSEVGSEEQKKRDMIRINQADSLKSSSNHSIRQLQHKKIMVEEK